MPDLDSTHRRRLGHALVAVALAALGGGLLLLWGWNTLAVELFQAPALRFKHALAIEALVAGLAALPLVLGRRRAA